MIQNDKYVIPSNLLIIELPAFCPQHFFTRSSQTTVYFSLPIHLTEPTKKKTQNHIRGKINEKMKINQFDSEQFLKKMGERLEWDPKGCDIGNTRGGS